MENGTTSSNPLTLTDTTKESTTTTEGEDNKALASNTPQPQLIPNESLTSTMMTVDNSSPVLHSGGRLHRVVAKRSPLPHWVLEEGDEEEEAYPESSTLESSPPQSSRKHISSDDSASSTIGTSPNKKDGKKRKASTAGAAAPPSDSGVRHSKRQRKLSSKLLQEDHATMMRLRESDVIVNSKTRKRHPGNHYLYKVMEEMKETFDNAVRSQKIAVATEVIQRIAQLEPPGRFVHVYKGGSITVLDEPTVLSFLCRAFQEDNPADLFNDTVDTRRNNVDVSADAPVVSTETTTTVKKAPKGRTIYEGPESAEERDRAAAKVRSVLPGQKFQASVTLKAPPHQVVRRRIIAPPADGDATYSAMQMMNDMDGVQPVVLQAHDVLFGKGSSCKQHPGNKIFRTFVRQNKKPYEFASKREKQWYAIRVMNFIRSLNPPGRFIICNDDGTLVEASDLRVYEKTCQALRERKWRPLISDRIAMKVISDDDIASLIEANYRVLPPKINPGTIVTVYWPGDKCHYPAVVLEQVKKTVLRVKYDDDGMEEAVDITEQLVQLIAPELRR